MDPDPENALAEEPASGAAEASNGTPVSRGPSLRRIAVTGVVAVALSVVLVLANYRPVAAPAPAGSPGPTFNLPGALNAEVDQAGLMRSGGLWATQGSYLLTSTDNGASWKAGQLPTPYRAIYVLDPVHAWTIGGVHDPSGRTAPSIPASGLAVNRTTDGGRTWQRTEIPGQSCRSEDLAFADASRGYLICLASMSSAPGASAAATDAIFRTVDGGASWALSESTSGLGIGFAVGDANTLWSAPDFKTSQTEGVSLQVSRDAGVTWSKVALPEAEALSPAGTGIVTSGPEFWDAANGALAVDVYRWGESIQPMIWFYRTSDGGRSWTLTKVTAQMPAMGSGDASVGRQWAIVGQWGNRAPGSPGAFDFGDLSVSTDFGATWTDVTGSGIPANEMWFWLDFTDKDHGAGTIFGSPSGPTVLLLTSDGGKTWHPASFGDARAHVMEDQTIDAAQAATVAQDYLTFAGKDPAKAWNLLSSYSQRQFGSEPAFEAVEAALYKRVNYGVQAGPATRSSSSLNRAAVGAAVWDDLTTFAVMNRAYLIVVSYPGTTEPPQKLVVAPLSATGGWRVWVAG